MMKKESGKNNKEAVSKIDKKQLIVGIIILLVAILTLTYAFMGMGDKKGTATTANVTQTSESKTKALTAEEKAAEEAKLYERVVVDKEKPHVSLALTVTVENDVEYVVSFTTEEEIYFNGRNVVSQQIKKGTADYVIDFPVEKIKSFRLDMGLDSGNMVVKNIKLVGTQEEDISSPMYYEMLGRIDIGQDKSFVINDKNVPALIYHPEFKERQTKAQAEPKVKAEPEVKAEEKTEAKTEEKAETKEEAKK